MSSILSSCSQPLSSLPQMDFKSKQKKPIIYIDSVRKSGTHLLEKIFSLLQIKPGYERGNIHLSEKLKEKKEGKSWAELYERNKKFCILYRDPRDCVVSQVLFRMTILKDHVFKNGKKATDYTVGQLLDISLNSERISPKSNRVGYYANLQFKGMKMALLLKNKPAKNRHFVRFEDLIPEFSGGAPFERRYKVFKGICNFAGLKVSDEKIKQAMEKCWGGTWTYRPTKEKKVGQWKTYFEPRHIKLFHDKYNYLLLGLGYESDPNWHLKYLAERRRDQSQDFELNKGQDL